MKHLFGAPTDDRCPLAQMQPGCSLLLAALAQALLAFHRRGDLQGLVPFGDFLNVYPASPWRASLLANLGTQYLQAHAHWRALEAWDGAWTAAKDATDARGRAVADYAVGEWLALAASFGQVTAVTARLQEIKERAIGGSAASKITQARETVGLITEHPERIVPSGPQALVAVFAARGGAAAERPAALTGYVPTPAGTSLGALEAMARDAGLPLRMTYCQGAGDVPVPSVVH